MGLITCKFIFLEHLNVVVLGTLESSQSSGMAVLKKMLEAGRAIFLQKY